MADWPITHHLFADHLPLEGDRIILSRDGEKDSHITQPVGVVKRVAPHGDHAFAVYTDQHTEGVIVGRLSRWRLA